MKLKGILLDLDNTVYDYKSAHTPALQQTLGWLCTSLKRDFDEVQQAYASARQAVNVGLLGMAASHSRLLYFQKLCEQFDRKPYALALEAEDLYWRQFLNNMIVRPGFFNWLDDMKSLPIALVSDLTARIQFQKVLHLGLDQRLTAIVTSEETGCEKPDRRIFETAAEKLKLPAAQLCMIGDSWDRDMVGALSLNMTCYWWQEPDDLNQAGGSLPRTAADIVRRFSSFTDLTEMVQALV